MGERFEGAERSTDPEAEVKDSRPSGGAQRLRPAERAFVIQFDPLAGPSRRLRGRVELVSSGEATRFRSMRQLVAFMVEILRKPGSAERPSCGET